tara:strand:- start:96 stop:371 length:276 start_codon:yes stop_codon:yes gene_type:complete
MVISVEIVEQDSLEESEKKVHKQNKSSIGIRFGQLLLIASVVVFLLPNIFTSLTPNGYEIIAWMGWATALFILGIITIAITYLVKPISRAK